MRAAAVILLAVAALALATLVALAIEDFASDRDERDWREDWCCPECYAAHGQEGPCEDCPARRKARF